MRSNMVLKNLNKSIPILCLMLLGLSAMAQIEFGVKTGANLSTVKIEESNINSGYTLSQHFGIYGQYMFSNTSLNVECQIQNKGYSTDIDYYRDVTTQHLRYTYLGGSVLVGFHPVSNLTILFGPEFNYMINSFYQNDLPEFNKNWNYNDLNKLDFGMSCGIRYVFLRKFHTELIYNHGMSDINKNVSQYNRSFQLSLGYRIN